MEFHENKAKTPFIRLVQLWHAQFFFRVVRDHCGEITRAHAAQINAIGFHP